MKIFFTAVVIASLVLTSCKNELEVQESSAVAENTSVAAPTSGQPAVANTAVAQNPQTGSQMINPPHGQPGHKCEVAVGAPLPNSTPTTATTMTPTPGAPQMITTSAPAQQPVKTAPGMNPPHGQPGHKCEVAVGQPLNSAPKAAATSSTSGDSPVTITPAVLNSDGTFTPGANTKITTTTNNGTTPNLLKAPAAATKTAPGMNPAHGEPGHKCEVAVGAPLPK